MLRAQKTREADFHMLVEVANGTGYLMRRRDSAALPEHERDEHPADAPIAIRERMQCFEFGVCQCSTQQYRHLRVVNQPE